MENRLIITPKTKIGEMLDAYPELEAVLIGLAPTFSKLKNPILRKTIARVTSISQAALVGNVPLGKMVNTLRKAVGQDEEDVQEKSGAPSGNLPSWLNFDNIGLRYDAREAIAAGEHPLTQVMRELNQLPDGKIYEFITPFLPAPLLDKVAEKGYNCYTIRESENLFKSYFLKK
ncbi:MAG: hypothetical protein HW421_3871 [Ignavibacteria bacterium]|nr:hypothetical protein [Ignavibacteria bacterium]